MIGRILSLSLHILHLFTLLLVVYAMYQFTNPKNVENFEMTCSISMQTNFDTASGAKTNPSQSISTRPVSKEAIARIAYANTKKLSIYSKKTSKTSLDSDQSGGRGRE